MAEIIVPFTLQRVDSANEKLVLARSFDLPVFSGTQPHRAKLRAANNDPISETKERRLILCLTRNDTPLESQTIYLGMRIHQHRNRVSEWKWNKE